MWETFGYTTLSRSRGIKSGSINKVVKGELTCESVSVDGFERHNMSEYMSARVRDHATYYCYCWECAEVWLVHIFARSSNVFTSLNCFANIFYSDGFAKGVWWQHFVFRGKPMNDYKLYVYIWSLLLKVLRRGCNGC